MVNAVRAIQKKDAADINFLEQVLEVKRRSQEEINLLCNLYLEREDPLEPVEMKVVPEAEPSPAPLQLDGSGGRSRNQVWNILRDRNQPLTALEVHMLLPEEMRKSESNTYNILYNGLKSGHFKKVLTNNGRIKKFAIRQAGDPKTVPAQSQPLNIKELESFMRQKIKDEYLNQKRELRPREFMQHVNLHYPDATHNHLNALLAALQMSSDTTVIQLSKGQKKSYLIKTKDI